MKWLIIQSENQSKWKSWTPNWHMRECYSFKNALIKHGHDADTWGKGQDSFQNAPDFNSYDAIVCIENYDLGWLPDFKAITKPLKFHWIIDLHCQIESNYIPISKNCDIILHSTKSLIEAYSNKCPKQRHIWFPNPYDDALISPQDTNKDLDISFVGSMNDERQFWMNELGKEINIKHYFATGIDMINMISRTKVHFNKCVGCDINYRIMETIGLGTCLLTNRNSELSKLGFEDGKNCLQYDSIAEAAAKAREAINTRSWMEIGKAGYKLAPNYTYNKRIEELLKSL